MAELIASVIPKPVVNSRAVISAPSPFDGFVRKYGTTQRRGIFGYFVHHFGRLIVGGQYPQGSILPNEPELVSSFGISRTVIREAMKCLAGKGLVEIKTRVGTRVRDRSSWHHTDTDVMVWYYESGPSVEFMRSIKDLRRVLEPEASARAATRGTEAQIAAIGAAYQKMVDTVGTPDVNSDADLVFHAAIFAATQNMIYAQLIDMLAIAIYGNRVTSAPAEVIDRQRRSLPFHHDVYDAIRRRDPTAALAASNRLLDRWSLNRYDF